MGPRVLVVDNYDSFVYNLVQYLGELGADPVVRRNDAIGLEAARELRPDAVLLSPGPGLDDFLQSVERTAAEEQNILGVDLDVFLLRVLTASLRRH